MVLANARRPGSVVLGCDLYEAWAARLAALDPDRVIPEWQGLPEKVRLAWTALATDVATSERRRA